MLFITIPSSSFVGRNQTELIKSKELDTNDIRNPNHWNKKTSLLVAALVDELIPLHQVWEWVKCFQSKPVLGLSGNYISLTPDPHCEISIIECLLLRLKGRETNRKNKKVNTSQAIKTSRTIIFFFIHV